MYRGVRDARSEISVDRMNGEAAAFGGDAAGEVAGDGRGRGMGEGRGGGRGGEREKEVVLSHAAVLVGCLPSGPGWSGACTTGASP